MEHYDWPWAIEETAKGTTIKQVYKETLPPVSYKRFCQVLAAKRPKKLNIAPRIPHNPGEKAFVDFCDGLEITCRKTGKKTKTHFFCGVLPFSSYTFGVFVENQKLSNFLRCHELMCITLVASPLTWFLQPEVSSEESSPIRSRSKPELL